MLDPDSKRKRRTYTAEYRVRVLAGYEAARRRVAKKT